MSVSRKSPDTPASHGPFWTDVVTANGWRIQYNNTLDMLSPLKPYRLVDPGDILWVSTDTEAEMTAHLPELIAEYAARDALVTRKEVKEALLGGLQLIFRAAVEHQQKSRK